VFQHRQKHHKKEIKVEAEKGKGKREKRGVRACH